MAAVVPDAIADSDADGCDLWVEGSIYVSSHEHDEPSCIDAWVTVIATDAGFRARKIELL